MSGGRSSHHEGSPGDASRPVEVVDLLDDSGNNHDPEFAPVRPGGQKLDQTIDLSSGNNSDHDDIHHQDEKDQVKSSGNDSSLDSDQPSQTLPYMTPCQTPGQLQAHSERTPASYPRQTSTPFGATPGIASSTTSSSFHFVKDPGHANPFNAVNEEIRDEFHQTDSTLKNESDDGDDEEEEEEDEEDSAIASTSLEPHSPHKRPPALRPHDSSSSGEYTDEERGGSDILISPGSPILAHHRRQPTPKKRKLADLDLPDTCTVIHLPDGGGSVYLVGTAHFSEESQEDVARVIRQVQPDVVMLELCKTRSSMLQMNEAQILAESASMTPAKMRALIREKGLASGALYILLLSLSAKLTRDLGMTPGGEFRRAFNEARKIPGCMVHLGDRPIDITMKRAMGSLSFWQKLRFTFNILCATDTVSKEDVEKCKQKDLLATILVELAGEYPELSNVILNERDLFLAFSLRTAVQSRRLIMENQLMHNHQASHPVVVGVVGIGHVAGIQANFETVSAEDISRLVQLPVPTFAQIAIGKTLRFGFYLSLAYGGYRLLRGPMNKLLTR